ncbi:acetyl-CoA acetyltransferase family protein [Thermocatellispora tengchongensis]|uniref:acetyl-CoA C-acyltransferase n=1 Tax=Thermocatellispora tengchongensis TaxID=1073253 RepID=A0A840NUN4_9ACTN|nr:thiolase family protein [Thermocatellispora tengchongensis]MBB5132464.1 acetyl-CoA acetyltransferase family protein [Thermocatellispora tengchongensis]
MTPPTTTTDVFVLDAVRTPIGRVGGALAGVRPDDLAAHVVRAVADRAPELDPARIDDVIFGAANGAGEDNRNVARMAVLLAGLPVTVPGSTVNRLCGSGLEAAIAASRAVAVGDASLVVAGGSESMTRAPWVQLKPERAYARGPQTLHDTALGWRMVNPRMPEQWTVSLGESTEILAEKYGVTREAQDAFALRSHQKAAAAWERGVFADEVVPVPGTELERDEGIRPESSLEALARLKPVFRKNGTVTAGNSSPLNDGAAALLIGDEAGAEMSGRRPLARIVSRAAAGVEPHLFGSGPVEAARTALKRAGLGWSDLSAVELNEAFAAQSLACLAEWPDLDPEIVNVNGGAIAIGHPLGCSGARILGSLAWELHRRGGGYGLAAICIGVGQGLAVVLEGV